MKTAEGFLEEYMGGQQIMAWGDQLREMVKFFLLFLH